MKRLEKYWEIAQDHANSEQERYDACIICGECILELLGSRQA